MSSAPNRPALLNRALLTLVGLVVLLGGAYALLRGLGALTSFGLDQGRDTGLLPRDLTAPSWLPWVAAAGSVVVGLLCLLWLAAQVGRRRPASQTWRLPGGNARGTTLLDTDAAAGAVAEEIGTYSGVRKAGAAITGDRTQPVLHLSVTTENDISITDLRRRIATEALPRLRQALEIEDLPTEILLRLGETTRSHQVD